MGAVPTFTDGNSPPAASLRFALQVPHALLNKTAAQAIPSGALTAVTFAPPTEDTDTMFAAASPTRLTANTPGLYLLQAEISFAANATGIRYAGFFLNGSTTTAIANARIPAAPASDPTTFTISGLCRLAVGQYIELYAFQPTGAALNVVPDGVDVVQMQALWVAS